MGFLARLFAVLLLLQVFVDQGAAVTPIRTRQSVDVRPGLYRVVSESVDTPSSDTSSGSSSRLVKVKENRKDEAKQRGVTATVKRHELRSRVERLANTLKIMKVYATKLLNIDKHRIRSVLSNEYPFSEKTGSFLTSYRQLLWLSENEFKNLKIDNLSASGCSRLNEVLDTLLQNVDSATTAGNRILHSRFAHSDLFKFGASSDFLEENVGELFAALNQIKRSR